MDYIKIGQDKGYIQISTDGLFVKYIAAKKEYAFSDPEEKVRASFYVELIEKYQYKPELLALEITVPRRTPSDKADIVVFEDKDQRYLLLWLNVSERIFPNKKKHKLLNKLLAMQIHLKVNILPWYQEV